MEMDFSVSEDTQVVLLLCGALGRADRDLAPLTTPQYNAFALALNALGKRPVDLVADGLPNVALIEACCAAVAEGGRIRKPVEKDRVTALLRRGVALSIALDKWSSYGVRVVGRADAHYPERLRKRLGGKAAPVLYFSGNADLLAGGRNGVRRVQGHHRRRVGDDPFRRSRVRGKRHEHCVGRGAWRRPDGDAGSVFKWRKRHWRRAVRFAEDLS